MYVVLIEHTFIARTDLPYRFHVSSNSNSELAYFTMCAYFTLSVLSCVIQSSSIASFCVNLQLKYRTSPIDF